MGLEIFGIVLGTIAGAMTIFGFMYAIVTFAAKRVVEKYSASKEEVAILRGEMVALKGEVSSLRTEVSSMGQILNRILGFIEGQNSRMPAFPAPEVVKSGVSESGSNS